MTRLNMTLAAAVALATACGGNPEGAPPADVQNRIQNTVPALVTAIEGAEQTLEGGAIEDLAGVLGHVTGLMGGGDELSSDPQFLFGDGEDELSGDELVEWLNEHVFTDANHEGGGVYRLAGDDLCDSGDLECIDQADAVELRVRAEVAGDGLDLTIMIGSAKSEVLFIELRSESLDVTIDLAEVKAAVENMSESLGEEVSLPETMSGQLRAGIAVDGSNVTISGGVPMALVVAGNFGGDSISLSVAERDPVLALSVDLLAQSATIDLDVPRIDFVAPWSLFDDQSVAPGAAELTLGGLSGSLALSAMSESLSIDNLGLGDVTSRLSLDGADVVTIDLNADSGRRLDVELAASEGGVVVILDPELELEVGMHLAALPDTTDVPDELLDTVYAVRVQGSAPSLEFIDDTLVEAIKVLSGSLTVEAVGEASVTVATGECLYGDQEPGIGDHAIIGALAAGSCPL